nr:hypothetical protein [Rickettsia hoogstraalii]
MKDFETADSAAKIYDLIIKNAPDDVSFIDVDDTIIALKSKTFKKPPYNKMIDRIKENKSNYDNYEEIVSNWRLQRKVILIDEEWAEVINKLKAKFPVYALTQMNTGEFGNILSTQDWRYKELKSLGIEFSDNEELAACNSGQKDDAVIKGYL